MTNAGKRLFNWKRDCPDVRVALGILGRAGYANKQAANVLLNHSSFGGLRALYKKTCGRFINESIILSRMTHCDEIDNIYAENPSAYRRGLEMAEKLKPLVKGTSR